MTGCLDCDAYIGQRLWSTLIVHLENRHGLSGDSARMIAAHAARGYYIRFSFGDDRRVLGWTTAFDAL